MSDLDQNEQSETEKVPGFCKPYFVKTVKFPLKCPNGGYFDGEGEGHSELELAPTTGEEEDILMNESLAESGDQIRRVLANCLRRLGSYVLPPYEERTKEDKALALKLIDGLTINDSSFALVMLRRISVPDGDTYKFEHKCSQCGSKVHSFIARANLADMEVRPFPSTGKPGLFKLPLSGKTVRYRNLTVADSSRLMDLVRKYAEALPSMGLFLRIVDIDGASVASYRDLKRFSTIDREALRTKMEETEGGMDLSLNITCPKGHAETRMLVPDTSFFIPSFSNTRLPPSQDTP